MQLWIFSLKRATFLHLLQLACTNMLILRLALLMFAFSSATALAQVNIIQAPVNFDFVDMGFDAANDEVVIIGSVSSVPTIFELNAAQDGFTTQTLASLPGVTQIASVSSISPDAIRIAGSSRSTNSTDFVGATWLRTDPGNPTEISFAQDPENRFFTDGAWADGVVGRTSEFPAQAATWTELSGIEVLPGEMQGGIAAARDVSSNGQIIVGEAVLEVSDSFAAHYWDDSGINRLDDSIPGHTSPDSFATSVSPDGNYIGGAVFALDANDEIKLFPVIWEGPERTLRILVDENGDFAQGGVTDVSDSGFAVGNFFDDDFNPFGFIWNPDFTDGIQLFEDWLAEQSPSAFLPFPSSNVSSIATGNGKLFFTVDGSNNLELAFVEVAIAPLLLGDVSENGVVDFLDIAPFIALLSGNGFQDEADIDRSGTVDFLDISPFIAILSGQ